MTADFGALGYDRLLASIYQDLAAWPIKTSWLHQLARFFNLDSAVVILEKKDSRHIRFVSGIGFAQASIEYPATARAQDLWLLDPAHDLPPQRAVAFNRRAFGREHRLRDFFLRCLQPHGLSSLLCIDIDTVSDSRICIRLGRSGNREDFSAIDLQLLEGLSLHLRRALAQATESDSRQLAAGLQRVIDNLRLGMAVFDTQRRTVAINTAGSAALNRVPGVAAEGTDLRFTDPHRARQLIGYLDAAFTALRDDLPCPPLMLRTTAVSPLQVVAQPLRGAGAESDHAFLALFINPERGFSAARLQLLSELFGFSPAEAKVAALLADGFGVDAAADLLCKSRNTVRSHARAIYSKAEVDNQAQLAALLMSSAANLLA